MLAPEGLPAEIAVVAFAGLRMVKPVPEGEVSVRVALPELAEKLVPPAFNKASEGVVTVMLLLLATVLCIVMPALTPAPVEIDTVPVVEPPIRLRVLVPALFGANRMLAPAPALILIASAAVDPAETVVEPRSGVFTVRELLLACSEMDALVPVVLRLTPPASSRLRRLVEIAKLLLALAVSLSRILTTSAEMEMLPVVEPPFRFKVLVPVPFDCKSISSPVPVILIALLAVDPAVTVVLLPEGVLMIKPVEDEVGLIVMVDAVPVVSRLVPPAFNKLRFGANKETLVLEAMVCPLLICMVVFVAVEFMSSTTLAAADAVFRFNVLLPPPFGEKVKL